MKKGSKKKRASKKKMAHPWDLSLYSAESFSMPKRGRGRPKGSKGGSKKSDKSGLVKAKAIYVRV